MSQSALNCLSCGYRLAWQRPNGKLRVEPDVLVVAFRGDRVALTCSACGAVAWIEEPDGMAVLLLPRTLPRRRAC